MPRLTIGVLPPRVSYNPSQCLGHSRRGGSHGVIPHTLEPFQSETSSPLGFSPYSASLAFSVLKPLLTVVFIDEQAPTSALG